MTTEALPKAGDKFASPFGEYEVAGNRRWSDDCRDFVWDVIGPDGFIVVTGETALKHYLKLV